MSTDVYALERDGIGEAHGPSVGVLVGVEGRVYDDGTEEFWQFVDTYCRGGTRVRAGCTLDFVFTLYVRKIQGPTPCQSNQSRSKWVSAHQARGSLALSSDHVRRLGI